MHFYLKTISFSILCGALLLAPNDSFAKADLNQSIADPDSATVNQARLRSVIITGSAAYLGTLGGLYFAWYKNQPLRGFHLHDDFHDWLQMDKGGHMVGSYYIGMLGYESLRWAGVDKKKAIWYGGSMGSIYLTTIEILDGFSAGWGASVSDLAANTLGSALFISQQLTWDEQRILLKYSYSPTKFADYRPDVLGSNHLERTLKDYNGISYWLSMNPNSFGVDFFPDWLNVAIGYSASGMTGGSENVSGLCNGRFIPEYDRTRQFLFSLDADLSRIKTRSRALNMVFKALNFVKIPFPALEYGSDKKFKFYPLYF
jgi:hypothetical protein